MSPGRNAAHHHLGRMLAGRHAPGAYHWHHLLGVLHAVTTERSAEHEAVLRQAALHDRPLRLHPAHGTCHALPPEEMLRGIAVQTLGAWDRRTHRDVLEHVAEHGEHDQVRRMAREALRD